MSAASVTRHMHEKTGADIQVFVESLRDTAGDNANFQRELKVILLLADSSNSPEVRLDNGLLLKRGVRSDTITVALVYGLDDGVWKIAKVNLLQNK